MAIIDPLCNAVNQLQIGPELLESQVGRQLSFVKGGALATREDDPPASVDIAVIGGGPLGVTIACQLRHAGSLGRRFVLLDAAPELLQSFFTKMRMLGQRVMRSPYEHQIAPDGDVQLLDFARLHYGQLNGIERGQVELGLGGQRAVVPTDIFIAHTTHVAAVHDLGRVAHRFAVESLTPERKGGRTEWLVSGRCGRVVRARAVVIATGGRVAPLGGALAAAAKSLPGRVTSAYSGPLDPRPGERIAIIGSGLSTGHLIASSVKAGARPVWLVRREERYRCADVKTAYFRTEGVAGFLRLPVEERLRVLAEETRGSLMLEFEPMLRDFEERGLLRVHRNTEVDAVEEEGAGNLRLGLSTGESLQVNRAVVANGFLPDTTLLPREAVIIGGRYPLLDERSLEVEGCENLFVVGPLASLAVGPAAKNIDGARLAAQLLLPALVERFEAAARVPAAAARGVRIKGTAAIDLPREFGGAANVVH